MLMVSIVARAKYVIVTCVCIFWIDKDNMLSDYMFQKLKRYKF